MEVRLPVSFNLNYRLRLLENYTGLAIKRSMVVCLVHSLLLFSSGNKPVIVIIISWLETRDATDYFINWGIRYSINPAELLRQVSFSHSVIVFSFCSVQWLTRGWLLFKAIPHGISVVN